MITPSLTRWNLVLVGMLGVLLVAPPAFAQQPTDQPATQQPADRPAPQPAAPPAPAQPPTPPAAAQPAAPAPGTPMPPLQPQPTSVPGRARRGRIILLLADGMSLVQVAAMVGTNCRGVYKWASPTQL